MPNRNGADWAAISRLSDEDASAAALRRFDVIDVVQPRRAVQIDDEMLAGAVRPADRYPNGAWLQVQPGYCAYRGDLDRATRS